MDNLYTQKTINANNVFDSRFLDSKTMYLYCFNMLPSLQFMNCIDGEKAYNAFVLQFATLITNIHQYKWYKHKRKKFEFDTTIIVLKNNCVVEFDDGYCEILHDGKQDAFLQDTVVLLNKYKERNKREPLEINLIVKEGSSMGLRSMEIKRTKLDLALFYEDDFIAVNNTIMARLNKKNDKGIVLLHGLPGTGKTTYLRYLIGKIKKRVLFLSPNVAGDLMSPGFIDLLIDNPNTVVIIEDAENIIMDRRTNSSSSVSNLLNISDGLLADFLNVQLICTFNSPLTLIDSALMRKGRLIARYEFGKLGVAKAQKLSNHFKKDTIINRPMTIAEIANQHEQNYEAKAVNVLGFRQYAVADTALSTKEIDNN